VHHLGGTQQAGLSRPGAVSALSAHDLSLGKIRKGCMALSNVCNQETTLLCMLLLVRQWTSWMGGMQCPSSGALCLVLHSWAPHRVDSVFACLLTTSHGFDPKITNRQAVLVCDVGCVVFVCRLLRPQVD